MTSNAKDKAVTILYFAALREQRGRDQENYRTRAADAAELYAELAATHGFDLPQNRLRAAINHVFCPWNQPLREGDTVAFIPPIAGG
ncbi:molybdopterin synthase sulfur carrier subunit [Neisseria sp. HSC-16F19]|nr:MoaD/ThiS family protein [Neisseria sp. HSC-16F19]MCP2039790.1 molybdopterin synthase sulfur carrier subunit [Neisseria sp. HSC-16F19]